MTDPQAFVERRSTLGRKIRTLGVVGILILGAAATYLYVLPQIQPDTSQITPAAVAPAAVVRQVTALGEVLPVSNRVTVAAPTGQDAGRIAEIMIAEGARVARGDVLAVMDTEPILRAALDQAMADEDARQIALAARIADLDATGAQLEAQVQQLTVALDRPQLELDLNRAGFAGGSNS